MRIVERRFSDVHRKVLVSEGVHPLLARLYAARSIRSAAELRYEPGALIPPAPMKGIGAAAKLLADAIQAGKRLLIVADYDADGATACAVGMRALRRFGAEVDFLVPDRFKLGYGLTPELVDIAARAKPDILITVDNGIASVEGVARAAHLGIATLVTDHHLPGAELPQAACIVNPNQPGCDFPSKAIAGVGVMFYVMLALRAELRERKHPRAEVNLGNLTDLVALGTVADVVPLDANNRNLVAQGLRRIRAGKAQPGIAALLRAAGRPFAEAASFDLGFAAGPRLNAAGRLADMRLGVECLVTDDEARAANCAQALDTLNRERRKIEAQMLDHATDVLKHLPDSGSSFFEKSWHEGVVGILASRLKDRLHLPVVCFVSSGGMYTQSLDSEDPECTRGTYTPTAAYARTKRMQVHLAEAWARELTQDGVSAHSSHPGWADTPGVQTSLPGFSKALGPLLRSPESGADTTVWLLAAPEGHDTTGLFWHDRAPRPTHHVSRPAPSADQVRRLWQFCVETTGVPAATS